ncbi:MAG: YkgJ family cysteine cluster protein [Planctomycetota bacterium]|nr:YkgJ family cysteine cluster protein [Planctomycetota bacterium]
MRCGQCCTGTSGYVFVNRAEIARMAAEVGIDQDLFGKKYLRQVGNYYSLIEKSNGDCIFYGEKGCSIYESRPRQCKSYPFWKKSLKSRRAWKQVCEECPGSGVGRSPILDVQEIEKRRSISPI